MRLRPALILATLLALPVLATAQAPTPPPDAPHGRHGGPPSPERMTAHLSKELGLDEAQARKLGELNEKHATELKRLRDEHEKALREILTPEQWKKFEDLRSERRQRHRRGDEMPAPPA